MVAVVVLVLYGRSGVREEPPVPDDLALDFAPARRKHGRPGCRAGLDLGAKRQQPRPLSRASSARPFQSFVEGNRLFWFLTILAATAVAAWIITRVMIASGAGPGLTH